jgi:hypothetical protein
MAGDWIKMRLELQTHPKVVRILSAMRPKDVQTKTDKFRVVGGLHAVWGVFDTHSEDGHLNGYTPETLDHIIGWEGFSQAMIDVGWLYFDEPQVLELPDFSEHNGASGKRRAEDQKRKRDGRKSPQTVRSKTGQNADKMRTESGLEKRREENNNSGASSPSKSFDIRAELKVRGVDDRISEDWIKHRKAKGASVTETVLKAHIVEADKAALPLGKALAYACVAGWQGFRADWYLKREGKTCAGDGNSCDDITAGWK